MLDKLKMPKLRNFLRNESGIGMPFQFTPNELPINRPTLSSVPLNTYLNPQAPSIDPELNMDLQEMNLIQHPYDPSKLISTSGKSIGLTMPKPDDLMTSKEFNFKIKNDLPINFGSQKPIMGENLENITSNIKPEAPVESLEDLSKATFKDAKIEPSIVSPDISNVSTGQLALGAVKKHPLRALGYAGMGMANLGGLTDNKKVGGQVGGALLGYLLASKLGIGGPAMMALTGGSLGAQFDKLRAAREQQAQQAQYRLGR